MSKKIIQKNISIEEKQPVICQFPSYNVSMVLTLFMVTFLIINYFKQLSLLMWTLIAIFLIMLLYKIAEQKKISKQYQAKISEWGGKYINITFYDDELVYGHDGLAKISIKYKGIMNYKLTKKNLLIRAGENIYIIRMSLFSDAEKHLLFELIDTWPPPLTESFFGLKTKATF